MIKLSSYALAASLLSRNVKAACPTTDFTVTLAAGLECNYANLVANLPQDCTIEELFKDAIGNTLRDATIRAEVADLCAYDAPTQFVEIQGTYQLDRRYFAGGGPFVDGDDWNIDSGDVKRFEDNLGSKTLIKWPEYAARMEYNNNNGLGENGYPTNMNLETSCALQTAMCCFTDDSMITPFPSSTDVCRHDLSNSPQSNHIKYGWSVFPGSETPTYCVGMTWNDGNTELIGNMMYDISLRQTVNSGYRAGVPGAPMCGCIEHMPIVEKAACRTATKSGEITYSFSVEYGVDEVTGNKLPYVSASNSVDIAYADCADGNDLAAQFIANGGDSATIQEHLVGDGKCADDLTEYLNDEQFLHEGQHPTKYLTPNTKVWTDLVVGEGIRFQPPDIDPEVADAKFREMIEACTGDSGRYCIIRRVCDTCFSTAHRDIYYKRLTPLPPFGTNTTAGEKYMLDMFMNNFNSLENTMGPNGDDTGDFQLYSTYEDALAGTNPWTYCHYAPVGSNYGFPFECGPTGRVWNEWNSYIHGHGYANHHGFYVEKPPVAPA